MLEIEVDHVFECERHAFVTLTVFKTSCLLLTVEVDPAFDPDVLHLLSFVVLQEYLVALEDALDCDSLVDF